MTWKKDFKLKIDAHPEDGFQTVEVHQGVEYWHIDGLDINTLMLPKDDNVLGQIIDVCQQIIDHPDNPFNSVCKKPEPLCKCGHKKNDHSKENFGCMKCHVCGSFRQSN